MVSVDQIAFDALRCNRCGTCCERIAFSSEFNDSGWWQKRGPLGWLELWAYWMAKNIEPTWMQPQDSMLWFGQLTPFRDDEGAYRYSCSFLRRDGEKTRCDIYATRPCLCSAFPYGKPTHSYPGCVWDVELIDFEVVMGVADGPC